MINVIIEINRLLVRQEKTLAVTESCTGGLLSNLLTQRPGSSRYFILGLVLYSNQAKESILKIPHNLI
ncbi:MAG: CinA family protein, partial [Candidatus Omnitrophica bacterium]|nr:CinA family protein [Candidatus Omnitrophota bacterium]